MDTARCHSGSIRHVVADIVTTNMVKCKLLCITLESLTLLVSPIYPCMRTQYGQTDV